MSSDRRPRAFSTSSYGSSSEEAIPAMQTAHFGSGAGRSPPPRPATAARATTLSSESNEIDMPVSSVISNDQERQVLLLMLLAQVCALHDPTPRTFTVHVLELFERGILDRESIHFLFELGLVPSTKPTTGLLTNGASETPFGEDQECTLNFEQPIDASEIARNETATMEMASMSAKTTGLALTTATSATRMQQSTNYTTTYQSVQTMRSMEAKAIRRQLSEHDFPDKKEKTKNESHQRSIAENDESKSWDVQRFPLSLSRYQREFEQLSILNSGSFGTVFHAIRKLDGCDYAIKRITFDSMGYSNESIQKVIREVQCLAKVSEHPNIVRYYTSWLEPSWMTGGSASHKSSRHYQQLKKLQYDAIHNASPQKLLKDIEELLDSTTNCEKVNEYVNDDSSFSSSSLSFNGSSKEGESTFGFPHLRRSSWDGSRDSVKDDNWGSYHSHKVEPWADADYDDSFSPSGPARKQRFPQNATRKVSQNTKQYKYQISMYIQMQLCHPATLADWIRERNRQIPESDHAVRIGPAMEIFQQICSGLAHVHDNHIVHRDLKPNNVFVSKDGKKILIGDFGLSKELHEIACHDKDDECSSGKRDSHAGTQKHSHQSPTKSAKEILTSHIDRFGQEENALVMAGTKSNALTKDGPPLRNEPLTAGIGTASYAAPEQVKSKHYGTPADIFSLGLILLELVCCFETEHERLHNFQQCRYQKVPRWLEEHYEHVAEIILACTQTDARDRPTATELLDLSKSPTSPKTSLEVQVLKGQLLEKDKQLAEKDRIIEGMRLKMERMKASMSSTIMPPPTDRAVIENVLPSDDDDNESCNT